MASRLRQALDVSSAPPTNKQLLVWDSATGKWTPKTVTPTDIGAANASHTHAGSDITSAVANATNADKLDNLDSTAFALTGHSHADATTSTAGFMSAADKTKLDGLSTIAPKNAASTLGLSLTTAYQTVSNMSLTLDKAGTWAVFVTLYLEYDPLDNPNDVVARLMVGGVAQSVTLRVRGPAGENTRFTSTQHWLYTAPDATPVTATVEALKEGGTGASVILSQSSHMTAIWLSS